MVGGRSERDERKIYLISKRMRRTSRNSRAFKQQQKNTAAQNRICGQNIAAANVIFARSFLKERQGCQEEKQTDRKGNSNSFFSARKLKWVIRTTNSRLLSRSACLPVPTELIAIRESQDLSTISYYITLPFDRFPDPEIVKCSVWYSLSRVRYGSKVERRFTSWSTNLRFHTLDDELFFSLCSQGWSQGIRLLHQ